MPATCMHAGSSGFCRGISMPCDAATMCFAVLWFFIALVAVHDGYLVVICSDVIRSAEQNPLGRFLIELDQGDVWLFLTVKAAGTAAVCTVLLTLYHYSRRLALAVCGPLASFQLSLLLYLSLR